MDSTSQYATLHTLAARAAKLLGFKLAPEIVGYEHRAVTTGDDEQALVWTMPFYPKRRISVCGQFPRWGDHNELSFQSREPSARITLAPDCTPERAAREITRRLLPIYRVEFQQALAQRERFAAQRANRDAIADRLCDAGAVRTADPERFRLPLPARFDDHSSYGSISVISYSGEIFVELDNLDIEAAVRVLRALNPNLSSRQQ